ncbi:tetratricopeptide repeat protein [Fulvivirgaceae bacterium BMA10]|uniref:Tetratricopeptide repeat protein n=1 Tax=Splendidivirga corallicola TaxID=3051826 RepID=A0ABT8KTF5_9BACT|nr:tetratricopeptide repeat protein [Fulvivirgaceae bacterium BMA10]
MEDLKTIISRVEVLCHLQKYRHAEKLLRSVYGKHPEDYEVLSNLSLVLSEQGKIPEALKLSCKLVSLNPRDVYGLKLHAANLIRNAESPLALKILNGALHLNPADHEIWRIMAYVYLFPSRFRDINYKTAKKCAENALLLDPEDVHSRNYRALAMARLGQQTEAIKFHQETLKMSPDNSEVHAFAGFLEIEKENLDKAKDHFKSSLTIFPDNTWAKKGLKETRTRRLIIKYLPLILAIVGVQLVIGFKDEITSLLDALAVWFMK